MRTSRFSHASCCKNGKLYLFGGFHERSFQAVPKRHTVEFIDAFDAGARWQRVKVDAGVLQTPSFAISTSNKDEFVLIESSGRYATMRTDGVITSGSSENNDLNYSMTY